MVKKTSEPDLEFDKLEVLKNDFIDMLPFYSVAELDEVLYLIDSELHERDKDFLAYLAEINDRFKKR